MGTEPWPPGDSQVPGLCPGAAVDLILRAGSGLGGPSWEAWCLLGPLVLPSPMQREWGR